MAATGIISRFAPAPTGFLHLGHVVNAIYVWGITRALGGRVWLRVEDHDRRRSRHAFEAALLDDLDWLGFAPDAPPTDDFRAGMCAGMQSDRTAIYETALASLRARGLIYACECSRKEIASAATGDAAELRYPGTCADRGLAQQPGRALRVRVEDGIERFTDGIHGPVTQQPAAQCGDVVVRDRDGHWTYQFAVAVDDWQQGVTLVIRGDDLLTSTGRQMYLGRLFGRTSPLRFVHHPLIMKSPTQKLSKADGDTSVRDLRAGGLSAADIVGRAACAAGLTAVASPLPAVLVSRLPAILQLAERAVLPAE